ncbi:MAG: MBL fold metallo-hydrolase [Eubacterium sp.]|nr:MBL fold metallo-hydrolase [Candidatus Colimonas fimequi]
MLKATIVIDNITKNELNAEWGLCVYIEYNGQKYLLDTGSSDKYLNNAKELGIDLSDIDYAALSHAHYDHSGGYDEFFEVNNKAQLYVSSSCDENCYYRFGFARKYIGVPKGMMSRHEDRIKMASGLQPLGEGAWLVPHIGGNLARIGKRNHMYVKGPKGYAADRFAHEQSLVFETPKGLVVLNSCSHGGLENIVKDIECYMPGKKIYMTIGGLHLSQMRAKNVRKVGKTIRDLNIEHVITGHCTGDKSFNILKEQLGDKAEQMYSGMIIEV